ncbi:hypothetical protein [Chryseobacterium binzhouense]|uniref:hypothetical protein n=1 Tax=Chryseobacterium binzhouense TaxID=2593646 RepID=UPI0028969DC8|nr:hypothetical protein [Chryseobacterium binzhouense]
MKKIFFILLALTFFACKEVEPDIYTGENMLNFNKGVSGNGFVLNTQTFADYKISYGIIKAAQAPHQVKLVFDQANSTAVLNTDFQILNNGIDDILAGEVQGDFTIRINRSTATQAGKTAVFKLQSSTLPNAGFDQTFTLNISLTCPVSTFVGNFTNTVSFWNAPGTPVEILENSSTPNQLLIKDYLDVGKDLVLTYNPTTYTVTFADQNTGFFSSANGGFIWMRPNTALPSSFNPCTREMTLNVTYYIPNVGSYPAQIEKFVGF